MNVRLRGLLALIGGGAVFGLIAYWIAHPERYPFSHHPSGPFGAVLIGLPGAFAMIGIVELATGKSFRDVEGSWAELGAWRKFWFGSVILIVGLSVA